MRRARDEEFNYESYHLICVVPPHLKLDGWAARDDVPSTFELQVRTIFIHAYAEPQHDIGYKAASELPGQSSARAGLDCGVGMGGRSSL